MGILTTIQNKAYAIKEHHHLVVWHEVLRVYMVVLLIWGFYRLLSPLPVWVEELFLKGLVFGIPVLVVVTKKHGWPARKLGFTHSKLGLSLLMGLGLGIMLGLVAQLGQVAAGGLGLSKADWSAFQWLGWLGLAFATAFWEQLLFSGYILQRLEEVMPDEWSLSWVVGLLFVLLHVPALLLVKEVGLLGGLAQLILLFTLGLANSVLMLRTRSLIAPIMAQTCWGALIYWFG